MITKLTSSLNLKRCLQILLFGGLYALIFCYCYFQLDPDFGWHLGAGRYFIAHGIPSHDVFSYTAPDFHWIDHEWLSDILMWGAYKVGGLGLVSAGFAALWVAALAIASRGRWVIASLAVIGLSRFITNRPLAFTALFLALLMVIWRHPKKRWTLIPLFTLWANVHGGFVLGMAILLFLVVWERQWRWLYLIPAVIIASFINPYGPSVYVEIWRTLSDSSLAGNVKEWAPLTLGVKNGFYIVTFGTVLMLGTYWKQAYGIIAAGTLIAAVISVREYMPFVIISLPIISQYYQMMYTQIKHRLRHIGVVAIGSMLFLLLASAGRDFPIKNYPPEQAVRSLQIRPCSGAIFNMYNDGGYLIWQLPNTRFYIDGRMPSWEGPHGRYMDTYKNVLMGGSVTAQQFASFDIQCAIISSDSTNLSAYLQAQGWHASVKDDNNTLWRKVQ